MANGSATMGEVGSDVYTQHETGENTLGGGGAVVSGRDAFTWDQHGGDAYSYSRPMFAGTSRTVSVGLDDSVSSSWHDVGGDDLGESESIVGGSDSYTWDQRRAVGLHVADDRSATGGRTTLSVFRGTTESVHDVGGDLASSSLMA